MSDASLARAAVSRIGVGPDGNCVISRMAPAAPAAEPVREDSYVVRLQRSRTVELAALLLAAAAVAPPGAAAPERRVPVRIYAPQGAVGARCDVVRPLRRVVRPPAVLAGAMRALVAGPTRAERRAGYGGWFSSRTAGSVRSVRLVGTTAHVDLRDFSRLIPNASTSCALVSRPRSCVSLLMP